MAELSQAIASLQASSLPVVQRELPTTSLPSGSSVTHSELPTIPIDIVTLASSSLVDHSELPESDGDYSNLELVIIGSSLVAQGEPIDDTSLSADSLPVDESEPIDQATVDDTYTPESQVEQSELLEDTQDESASTLPEAPQQFTREQLGKILGVSRETIRIWQRSGEIERRGWAVVPKTGSTPKNPIKYQKQV